MSNLTCICRFSPIDSASLYPPERRKDRSCPIHGIAASELLARRCAAVRFTTALDAALDEYRGAVPLSRQLALACQIAIPATPTLALEREHGDIFIRVTFADTSFSILGIEEE